MKNPYEWPLESELPKNKGRRTNEQVKDTIAKIMNTEESRQDLAEAMVELWLKQWSSQNKGC